MGKIPAALKGFQFKKGGGRVGVTKKTSAPTKKALAAAKRPTGSKKRGGR